MKKLLIATAALAMVAGTAHAQSTVTVYGKLDAGYSDRRAESISGAKATTSGVAFNAHETSRFGLRGSEDLGSGLKANFVIETQLGDDNANKTGALQGANPVADEALGGRALWVGVSGNNFGEVRVGHQNAFSKDYVAGFSSSGGSNVIGDPTMAAGRAVEKTSRLGLLDSRYTAVSFASPSFSGFKVKAMVVAEKGDTDDTTAANSDQTGSEFAVEFNQGPLAAAASYGKYSVAGKPSNSTYNYSYSRTVADGIAGTQSADKTKYTLSTANLSYDAGVAKVFLKYGTVDAKVDGGSAAVTDGKASTTVAGVRVPFGSTTFLANYAMGDYEPVTGSTKFDDSGYQVGLEHALSKRTKVYAIYGATESDISSSTKEKDTQFAFGLIHNF